MNRCLPLLKKTHQRYKVSDGNIQFHLIRISPTAGNSRSSSYTATIVHHRAEAAGLDTSAYGTYSMRWTKATLIYKRTKNLRAIQLLLGHSKLESTVRYLGIEVDDGLEIFEQTEI